MNSLDRTASSLDYDSAVGCSDESSDNSPAICRTRKVNRRVISDSDEENDSSISNSLRSNTPDKSWQVSKRDLSSLQSSLVRPSVGISAGELNGSTTSNTSLLEESSSLHLLSRDLPRVRISESESENDDNSTSNLLVRNNLSPKLIEETDDDSDSVVEVLNESSVLDVSSQSEGNSVEILRDSYTKEDNTEMVLKIKTGEKASKLMVQTDIEAFLPLVPDSVPNSKKIYVKKEVRDNELARLVVLQEDLFKLKSIMDDLNIDKLPDGGRKLQNRYSLLMIEVKKQKELLSNMVEATAEPTAEDLRNDGFDLWDQIQTESTKVESKHHGKQGMNTHNVQMNETLLALRAMHEDLSTRPDEKANIDEPKCLKVSLLPHQNQALAWLLWRESKIPRGGILADDMGLGKTLTMIALIARSKYDDEMKDDDEETDKWISRDNKHMMRGGTLIVCPASLLSHWEREIQNRCKKYHFSVILHHGSKRENRPHRLAKAEIVITTYNLITKDLDKLLGKIAWKRIILDEAHVVRNSKSLTAKSVCALTGKHKWCLTGTPVHNKNLDLYALVQFLGCSPFDDLQVWKKWIDNKSAGAQERLALITKCLMLRRTKEQLRTAGGLKDLPDKTYQEVELELSKQEMAVYQKILVFSRSLFAQFLHQRAEKDAATHLDLSGESQEEYYKMHKKLAALQGGKKIKAHEILVLLLRLRQICCHPGLIATMLNSEDTGEVAGFEESSEDQCIDLLSKLNSLNLDDDKETDNQTVEAQQDKDDSATITEAMRSVLSSSNPVFDLQKLSSKMQAVFKCLYEDVFTHNGDKAILVSQWTSMLNVFEKHLKSAGVKCSSITGSVPVPLRAEVVEKFNDPTSDVQVLLLSLCAGGVGLNLIGGNHLLLVDLHWNPQLEVQAQDRIYRVGQKKPVFVYRFRCLDTIEQKIKQLQDSKLALADNVLTGTKHESSAKLTLKDMKVLFDMQ